ncbi:hypothetical protein AB0I81_40125 [Nonomuraea sp. NPDC050404]|uniref:hypothetical protein n=1 Tax=Nonomuraea sp. NPDC050404 TaxID=3155783 RepID=UPI0034093A90
MTPVQTSQTVTTTAVRNNRSTVYEVEFQGRTFTRIAFREYRWCTIVESPNGERRAAWSKSNTEALYPADADPADVAIAVILLAQPDAA